MTLRCLFLPLLLACTGSKSVGLGQGAQPDARLIADLYTWPCEERDKKGEVVDTWEGVFSYNLSFEYAPDALLDRGFPSSGCSLGADLFPADAGPGAYDLPDVDAPSWSSAGYEGTLTREAPGFYRQEVFANQRSCTEAQDLLGSGTLLTDAGAFTDAQTPAPGSYDSVEISGEVNSVSGLSFGAEVTAAWDASKWTESWVQVRREQGGALVQSVTCNTSGQSSFTIDDEVWAMLSDALEVDVTNLYIGLQNRSELTMADTQIIEIYTRAMHVAVVQE